MKKKILLDRFESTTISNFCDDFKKTNYDVRIISYNGATPSLKNYDGELLNDFEITKGFFFKDVNWVLESEDLEFISKFEGLFHDLLSRFALSPAYWASHEMSVHATSLINFWKYKLVSEKIEVCFAFYAPHDPSSFSLYLASKLLKIPYIFIDSPNIAQKILFMSCSYKHRNLLIRNKTHKSPEWAKKILKDYQQTIKNDFMSLPKPVIARKDLIFNKEKINKILYAFKNGVLLKKIVSAFFSHKLPSKLFFKYNRSVWSYDKAVPNVIILLLEKIKILRRISRRRKNYIKICSLPENKLNGKSFIYFPAPASPEGSHIPTALWNRHIKLSILKIISVIPNDWKVVYKANPAQFKKNIQGQFTTFPDWFSSEFYSDLLKTRRVSFASIDTPTKELIENSMGVASINGTVSSEAIALGKHAIIFSPMWYDDFEGVHYCKTQLDLKNAISLMENKVIPVPEFSNLHLSSASIFENRDNNRKYFNSEVCSEITKKFILSYEVFKNLDEKKWSI